MLLRINKKGALFHWIVLGLLLATGLFFMNFGEVNKDAIKGEWQISFLNNVFLPAEHNLLSNDDQIRIISQQTLLDLGAKGCGEEIYPLWDDKDCLDSVKADDVFSAEIKKRLSQTFPERSYHDIEVKKNQVSGEGNRGEVINKKGFFANYSYDTDFSVDLGYDFDEFRQVLFDSEEIVSKCKNSPNMEGCLNKEFSKKEINWGENLCKNDDKLFYGLYLEYQRCLETSDDNCLCSLNLVEHNLEDYLLEFNQKNDKLEITNGKESYQIELGNKFHITPSTLKISGKEAELFFPNKGGQQRDYTLVIKNNLVLLKRGGKLDFVNLKNNEIRLWNNKIERLNNPFVCSQKNPSEKNLCVESNTKVFDMRGNLLPIRYRFALNFG